MVTEKLVTVGSKVTQEQHTRLRWLAFERGTTVSALIAMYVTRGLNGDKPTELEQNTLSDPRLREAVDTWSQSSS